MLGTIWLLLQLSFFDRALLCQGPSWHLPTFKWKVFSSFTLSLWAFYRFDKLFFLSSIDSCLVSFFGSCEQSLSSCEVRLATSCGARRHFGLWGRGKKQDGDCGSRDVQGPFTWTSFAFVSWTQHLACLSNFADVFIVGKCIFQKSLGPDVCSCNPTSLLLDSRLQSTVLLFGTVSLYVCVKWVTWSSLCWTSSIRSRLHLNVHIKWGSELLKVHATLHLFSHICKFKNVSAFTTVSVVYSCDSLFPWKVRQGGRVVVKNIAMDVPLDSMPGPTGPINPSSDSYERSGAASSSRSHVRERSPRGPPPPTHLPFLEMASLDNLSRDQRFYHYVQCPVLCLDSNSIHVKSYCLWFVFCVCESCHFKVLTSCQYFHHHGVVVTVNSGQRSCVTTTFHVKLEIAWPLDTPNGRLQALCGLAEGCIGYLQFMIFDSP